MSFDLKRVLACIGALVVGGILGATVVFFCLMVPEWNSHDGQAEIGPFFLALGAGPLIGLCCLLVVMLVTNIEEERANKRLNHILGWVAAGAVVLGAVWFWTYGRY